MVLSSFALLWLFLPPALIVHYVAARRSTRAVYWALTPLGYAFYAWPISKLLLLMWQPRSSTGRGALFQPQLGAPVTVLGDSVSTVSTNAQVGGCLAAFIASQLNVDVDVVASAGGGSSDSCIAFEARPEHPRDLL